LICVGGEWGRGRGGGGGGGGGWAVYSELQQDAVHITPSMEPPSYVLHGAGPS